FSPVIAEDIEQVHQEALRVLRQQLAQPGDNLSTAAGASSVDAAKSAAARAGTEAGSNTESQQRQAERERLQAARREQFDQFVKERERQREHQQRVSQPRLVAAAASTELQPATSPSSDIDNIHAQALQVLRQQGQPTGANAPAATGPQPSP